MDAVKTPKSDKPEKPGIGKPKTLKDKDKDVKFAAKEPKHSPDPKDAKDKAKKGATANKAEKKSERKSKYESEPVRDTLTPGSSKDLPILDRPHRRSHGTRDTLILSPKPESPPMATIVKDPSKSNTSLALANNLGAEKDVVEVVEEYWATAWDICSERFHEGNAPISATLQLRDTWLRVMESEWMDSDLSIVKRQVIPSRVFTRDEPPPPLQNDSWCRGALQLLPPEEPVLDPVMRDKKDPGSAVKSNPGKGPTPSALLIQSQDKKRENLSFSATDNRAVPKVLWNQPARGHFSYSLENSGVPRNEEKVTVHYESDDVPKSPELVEGQLSKVSLVELERVYSWNVLFMSSRMESKSSIDVNKSYERLGVKPWSPSDCGGRKGSGVFRLINESTNEVIRRTNPNYKPKKRSSQSSRTSGSSEDQNLEDPERPVNQDENGLVKSTQDIFNTEAQELTNARQTGSLEYLYPVSNVQPLLQNSKSTSTTCLNQQANENPGAEVDEDSLVCEIEGPTIYMTNSGRMLTEPEKKFVQKKILILNVKLQCQQRQQQLKLQREASKELSLCELSNKRASLKEASTSAPNLEHWDNPKVQSLTKIPSLSQIAPKTTTTGADKKPNGKIARKPLEHEKVGDIEKRKLIVKKQSRFTTNRQELYARCNVSGEKAPEAQEGTGSKANIKLNTKVSGGVKKAIR